MKNLAMLMMLAVTLSVSAMGCGQSLQGTAQDVTDHVVFKGTLAGLLGACNATAGANDTWDTVCDGVRGLDALSGIAQTGAGPAELPADLANRQCLALEDGTVRCGS